LDKRKNSGIENTAMKIFFVMMTLLCGLAISGFAAEIIPEVEVDGKVYRDVRWGPVNQGNVMMFHNRGVKSVAIDKLPEEYRALFNVGKPSTPPVAPVAPPTVRPPVETAPPPAAPAPVRPLLIVPPHTTSSSRDPDWESYNKARATKLVMNNKLVERSSLTSLVGFVGSVVSISDGTTKIRGTMLEVAEPKENAASTSGEFALRPNLWRHTGKMALLRNYKAEGETGILVRVYVTAAEDVDDHPSYNVAAEPSFEQWKQLRSINPLFR
jgi:hypothetical protein